jgi:3-oxoacyl-(acyl-carrier-protein) synthase/acyl carrier protein/short-subunit dehydrogenase
MSWRNLLTKPLLMETTNNPNNLDALKKAALTIQRLQKKVADLERGSHESIAVVGMACRFPGQSSSIAKFWEKLKNGFDAKEEIPSDRFDISNYFSSENKPGTINVKQGAFIEGHDQFDAGYFGISAREANLMDPQQRILLEVTIEALEDAFLTEKKLSGSLTGVFVGCMGHDYAEIAYGPDDIDIHTGTGTATSVLAGRISYLFNLHGPSMVVDTACSSSLVAVNLAVQSLRNTECNCAVAAGVNLILSPSLYLIESRNQMLADDGKCKTFDNSANGFLRGEGCGVVVLKRLSDAVRDGDRIYALIKGTAVNHNGRSSALMVPSGKAQEQLLQTALQFCGTDPTSVSFVEAHGTGTSLGDPIEVNALEAVLGKHSRSTLLLGSVKSNIGHLEGAAGIAGFIKTVLSLYHHQFPPSIHFNEPNRHIQWDKINLKVNTCNTPLPEGCHGAVSSFGFSGTNVHTLLSDYPKRVELNEKPLNLLLISAKSKDGLQSYLKQYASYLSNTSNSWTSICYTSIIGRTHHKYRFAIWAKGKEEALHIIEQYMKGNPLPGIITGNETNPIAPNDFDNLKPLAQAHVSGAYVDWEKVFEGTRFPKVGIPTYPWENRSYWISNQGFSKKSNPIPYDHIYAASWTEIQPVGSNKTQKIILQKVGQPNISFDRMISGSFPIVNWEDMNEADRIILLFDCTQAKAQEEYQLASALLSTCKKLQDENRSKKTDIVLFSDEERLTSTPILHATNAMLCSLRTENSQMAGGVALVPGSVSESDLKKVLLTLWESDDSCLAFENNRLLRLGIQKIEKSGIEIKEPTVNGWIIVLGGSGSIGQHFIKSLIEKGATRIMVTMRHPENTTLDFDRSVVTLLKFDPAVESDWQMLTRQIEGEKVSGLIHASGHFSHKLLTQIGWEDLTSVSAPKVEGGRYLVEWCKMVRPEWVMLNSSAVAITGAPYLSHYAFANGYLNGIGALLNRAGIKTTCIDWGGWDKSNMLNNSQTVEFQKHYGFSPLNPRQQLAAAWFLATGSVQQAVVVKVDWEKFKSVNQFKKCSWLIEDSNQNKIEKKPETPKFNSHQLLKTVVSMTRQKLEMKPDEEINLDMAFEEMGFDSLMSVELIEDFRKQFNITISTTLLYEYSTIRKVTQFLEEKLNDNPDPSEPEELSLDDLEALLNQKLNKNGIG